MAQVLMPMAQRMHSVPGAREDVISSILSDYGNFSPDRESLSAYPPLSASANTSPSYAYSVTMGVLDAFTSAGAGTAAGAASPAGNVRGYATSRKAVASPSRLTIDSPSSPAGRFGNAIAAKLKPLPPPPSKGLPEKPLPPVMRGFRLRVNDAAGRNSAAEPAKQSSGQERPSPLDLISRSIDRSGKPPSLRLTKSNGSTASASSTSSLSSSPPNRAQSRPLVPSSTSGVAVKSALPLIPRKEVPISKTPPSTSKTPTSISRTTPRSSDRPLPGLPPAPPPKPAAQPAMGQTHSKEKHLKEAPVSDSSSSLTSPKAFLNKLARRPNNAIPERRPTLADLASGPRRKAPPPPVVAPKPLMTAVSIVKPSASGKPSPLTPSNKAFRSQPDLLSSAIGNNNETTPRGNRSHNRSVSEQDLNAAADGSVTPIKPLEPLPTTAVVSGEEIDHYGFRRVPTQPDTPEEDEQKTARSLHHTRGKSSTGFDLFKDAANAARMQSTRDYLNVLTPSPTPSPIGAALPSLGFEGNRLPSMAPVNPIPHEECRLTPGGPDINRLRPQRTNAVPIRRHHALCVSSHRRFHQGKNVYCSLDCQVCYSDDKNERWTCTSCSLRICTKCRKDLVSIPDRNVAQLITLREQGAELPLNTFESPSAASTASNRSGPGVEVWEASPSR